MRITCVTHPLLHYNVHNTHLALFAFSQKKTSPAVKNKEIYTFLIAEAIILADWCKFSDKDGLDFTFFLWVHDRSTRFHTAGFTVGFTAGFGEEREELVLRTRGTGTYNTKWRFDWRDTKKRRESFLIWPIVDRNFNFEMGKSFNII